MTNLKPTKSYTKRIKSLKGMTEIEFTLKKQKIENYCQNEISNFDQLWSKKYYFSNTPKDFVKLVKYYPYHYSTDTNKELEGINFERVERDTTNNLLDGLNQGAVIINALNKSYRQRIIDSNELTNFLLALLEVDEWTERKDVYRYAFAQNLFNTALKILIDESPKPIRKHMINAIKQFYEFASLPVELGYRHDRSLIKPIFEKIRGTDEYNITLETKLIETKPRYVKNKKQD